VAAVELCRAHGVPLTVLGGGSNVIVPDEGVRGLTLRLKGALDGLHLEGEDLVAQAGVLDETLSGLACDHGISGCEWLFDIPGTVGGAVLMNAGNNDGQMSDVLRSVTWVTAGGRLETCPVEQLGLAYRKSRFQGTPDIVVEARIAIRRRDRPSAIRARMEAIRDQRRSKFPAETRCAGSIFKRPPGDFAGRLIEVSGCGGLRVGGAEVSDRHKGFIVNTGGATAADVLALIDLVRGRVLERTGTRLETEVEVLRPLSAQS
jgi:UDP-N-acetylmuramate dehydrogenase